MVFIFNVLYDKYKLYNDNYNNDNYKNKKNDNKNNNKGVISNNNNHNDDTDSNTDSDSNSDNDEDNDTQSENSLLLANDIDHMSHSLSPAFPKDDENNENYNINVNNEDNQTPPPIPTSITISPPITPINVKSTITIDTMTTIENKETLPKIVENDYEVERALMFPQNTRKRTFDNDNNNENKNDHHIDNHPSLLYEIINQKNEVNGTHSINNDSDNDENKGIVQNLMTQFNSTDVIHDIETPAHDVTQQTTDTIAHDDNNNNDEKIVSSLDLSSKKKFKR